MSEAPAAKGFARLRLSVASSNLEMLMAELLAAGCLGAEICAEGAEVLLDAYFPAAASWPVADWLATRGGRLVEHALIADRDWLECYRRSAAPFALGSRFTVDPREPRSPEDRCEVRSDGRTLLRLPARRAFGVGSHESTRLAVKLLETLVDDSASVLTRPLLAAKILDLGCGAGILAFAAQELGTGEVLAADLDPAVAFAARENARLNERSLRVFAGSLQAFDSAATFDLVLANVLPEHLEGLEAELVTRIRPGGALIHSGVWWERSAEVLSGWRRYGLGPRREARERGWVAWILAAVER